MDQIIVYVDEAEHAKQQIKPLRLSRSPRSPPPDDQLAGVGAQLLYARLRILRDLLPHLATAYDEVSAGQSDARLTYRSSLRESFAPRIDAALDRSAQVPTPEELREEFLASFAEVVDQEVERGVTLVGTHRDDLVLALGALPAKGYASHGESWSFALGLKLAAFELLRHDLGEDPVLVLDDVFAELDSGRRERLAARIADAEQVLITAAVGADVPRSLAGQAFEVELGSVVPSGAVDTVDEGVVTAPEDDLARTEPDDA